MLKYMLRICKCQILSRLELPSLKLYTFVSFVSFAVLVLFVSHPSSEFNHDENNSDTSTTLQPIQTLQKLTAELSDEDDTVQNQPIHWLAAVICVNTGNFSSYTWRRLKYWFKICFLAACILLLFALSVTRIVFGELRTQELNSAKDKFWNFVFYKVNIIHGVINWFVIFA